MFADRSDAADQLAAALARYRDRHPLVLGIPRGGVPMARRIADHLGGELDVVLVRKLGAPGNPEYAIGSMDETGRSFITPQAEIAGATPAYLDQERARQLAVLAERRTTYTAGRRASDPSGRVVIVVDDGLATGSTMIAALHALRARNPRLLVCAVPVAPPETIARVRAHADEVVCLHSPGNFYAVGQFYRNFPQVDDREVVEALAAPLPVATDNGEKPLKKQGG
jgi:predicted phosphoribosyltransferase